MEAVWNEIKAAIKEKIPGHCYKMWIEPIEFDKTTENGVFLSCPNQFYRKRILTNYASLMENEMNRVMGGSYKLILDVRKQTKRSLAGASPAQHQMLLPSIHSKTYSGRMLRQNFTFDQFVVGKNNGLAYSAALSLASKKSSQQNSVFLLSKTGNGKSHLSQAVGHHILSLFPTERVFYITAEDFTNEMTYSFQNNSIGKFKAKYQNQCDVLLLEDVHYLSGKGRTQQELALVLDTLFEADKKIIFSSCYLPGDIPKLDEKLRSRLGYGLISTIETPEYKTRVKILQKKSTANGCNVPREVVHYLADSLVENVRQLESGLIGVVAKSSLLGMGIDLKLAESVVKNIVRQRKTITVDVIKKLVCEQYKVNLNELVSRSRKQRVLKPRQVAIFLSRRYTDQPLQAIGKSFNRYHATALHAIGCVERELKHNAPLKQHVKYLSKKLESGDF
jgi:chromosomal replication initiator protein